MNASEQLGASNPPQFPHCQVFDSNEGETANVFRTGESREVTIDFGNRDQHFPNEREAYEYLVEHEFHCVGVDCID